jgi:hypothetical protein
LNRFRHPMLMSTLTPDLAPRDYTTGAGMPSDRVARQAARQAFTTLKMTFIQALDDLEATEWLRELIRGAEEPVDLWLLRAPVFAALSSAEPQYRSRRQLLRRGLDSMFPDLEPASGFMPL